MNQLNQTNDFRQQIINFISNWQNNFILDYWWRKKYNVPFGSIKHREMNFIDMFIEYQEDIEIRKIEDGTYKNNYSQKEIDEDYDKINLEDY